MRSEEEKCFPQPDRFPGHSDRNAPGTGTTAYGTSGSGSFSSPQVQGRGVSLLLQRIFCGGDQPYPEKECKHSVHSSDPGQKDPEKRTGEGDGH